MDDVETTRDRAIGAVMPVGGQTIWNLLREQAEVRGEATALCAPGRSALSFARLFDLVRQTALDLRKLGIRQTDRVAVVLPDGPELAAAFLAVSASAACAPLNPSYRVQEFEFYLRDLDVRAVVVGAGADSPVRVAAAQVGVPVLELRAETDESAGWFTLAGDATAIADVDPGAAPGDVALLLHTSGTTSRPKLVPLAHANLCASARHIRTTLSLSPSDRCLCVMPLFHIHGLVGSVLSSLSAGASVFCSPGFYAPRFFEWMEQCDPTWFTAVPTMLQSIAARAPGNEAIIGRRTLRFIRSSSSPLAPALMSRLESTFGVPVVESYGMTEASHQMASNPLPPGRRKAASVGLAAGPEIQVLDDERRPARRGDTGEVVIRGPNVTAGYERNEAANAEAYVDGWFRTGDRGYLDEEGYLFLTGRSKEMINRGGEKISPREIDEVLLEHPAVDQALTFAFPHPRLGEEIAAAIVRRPGADVTEMQLQEFASKTLADFKVPRRIVFLDEIPKGPTGKLQRIGLAEKLGVREEAPPEAAGEFVAPRSALEQRLCAIVAGALRVERVGVRDNFFLAGGDSVIAAQLLATLAAEHGRTISIPQFLAGPTVEHLAHLTSAASETEPEEVLVPIQPAGSLPPLFCAQTLEGGLMAFANIARHLGSDQPVIGLPQPDVAGLADVIPIEEQARRHVRAVLKMRPQGPYLLLGWCFGGQLVYEMARQLREQGHDVPLTVMMDCFNHAWLKARPAGEVRGLRLAQFARRARFVAATMAGQGLGQNVRFLRGKAQLFAWARRKQRLVESYHLNRLGGKSVAGLIGEAESHNYIAARTYVPKPYAGRVLLLRTRAPREDVTPDAMMGWGDLMTGAVESVEIPGDHYSALSEPHVQVLAGTVQDRLHALRRAT